MGHASTCFVGLDYHQQHVQVCVLDAQGQVLANRRVSNHCSSVAGVVPAGRPVAAAIEAGTGAADLGEQLIQAAGWDVSLAHAQYVARLKQSPDKSDFSDAQLLGDLRRVGYLPRTWLAPQRVRELRRLVAHRQQLADRRRHTKMRVQAIRRDHRLTDAPARPWTQSWLGWLREHPGLPESSRWLVQEHLEELAYLNGKLTRIEKKLAQVTAGDALVQRLRQLPGVGPVTAWMLRARIGRFDRFRTAKQLCRYCGLSPRNASSGSRQADAGVIRAADGQLRAVLIQAAQRLMYRHERYAALGRRLKARGKAHNVAAVAVANRWMRWVYHQVKEVTA